MHRVQEIPKQYLLCPKAITDKLENTSGINHQDLFIKCILLNWQSRQVYSFFKYFIEAITNTNYMTLNKI